MLPDALICGIAVLAAVAVILRPFGLPEATWPVAGAVLLVALGLLSPTAAILGVARGLDVYLFLFGMMLLSETARGEGLFDWLAAVAAAQAKGSGRRLFLLVYAVGVMVTIFLSNDATAIVLTPAVAAAVHTAKVDKPLPYLLSCAFVANAASFVLPISNPANLVIYGSHMPLLPHWLSGYLLPSALAIAGTFLALWWTQRGALQQGIATEGAVPSLSGTSRLAAFGLGTAVIVLLAASALGIPLGLPTAVTGTMTMIAVTVRKRQWPWKTLQGISWTVLPLVAGLFVLVEALNMVGVIHALSILLQEEAQRSTTSAAWSAGIFIACADNLVNNLPAALVAGNAMASAHVPDLVTRAALIGIDLGPNLSVTGSLATILWLTALRREGLPVSAATFLKVGLVVMPCALFLAIGAAVLVY